MEYYRLVLSLALLIEPSFQLIPSMLLQDYDARLFNFLLRQSDLFIILPCKSVLIPRTSVFVSAKSFEVAAKFWREPTD